MLGRRIPIPTDPSADPAMLLERPGDYIGPVMQPVQSGELRPSVWFWPPVEQPVAWKGWWFPVARVCSPPHRFRECADGSLEIRESILMGMRDGGYKCEWHGYLDEGHNWRTV